MKENKFIQILFILLLSVAMMFSFVACTPDGGDDDGSSGGGGTGSSQGTGLPGSESGTDGDASTPVSDFLYIEHQSTIVITGCNSAQKTIVFPAIINSKPVVAIMTGAFMQNTTVETAVLLEGIERIEAAAFYGCSNLKTINIPQSVKDIGSDAFYGCSSLEKVKAVNLDAWLQISFASGTANPLSNSGAYLCINNQNVVNLSFAEGTKKTNRNAFYGCTTIESVAFPSSFEIVEMYSFQNCSGIKTISIPAQSSLDEIMPYAFANCDSLTSVSINVKKRIWWNAFDGCDSLVNVQIGKDVKTIDNSVFANCILMETVVFDENSVLETIGEKAFEKTSLKNITLPASLKDIGPTAFAYTKIEHLVVPAGIKTVGYRAFENSSLKTITFGDGTQFYSIGNDLFFFCSSLEKVDFGSGSVLPQGADIDEILDGAPEGVTVILP